jgi:hypothetical protein
VSKTEGKSRYNEEANVLEREQGLNVAVSGAISMAFSFPCGGTGILFRILAKDFLSHSKDWGKNRLLT